MELSVCSASFGYVSSHKVFQNVSFSLHDGDSVSILGANGAGKSTLLNCISGLIHLTGGEILLDNENINSLSRTEIAKRIGYVPQIHGNVFNYSVLEYVVMGRTPYISAYSTPGSEDYEVARKCISKAGLASMENRIISELSGGERQLAVIARVLAQEAKCILLDEPTNHLDYGNQYRIIDIMRALASEGFIILTTTHNPNHALALGGKVAIITHGEGVDIGKPEELLTPEGLSAMYRIDIDITYPRNSPYGICYPFFKESGWHIKQ